MLAQSDLRVTAEEYLALERAAAFKSEFHDGYIVAMSGATREHNLVTANLARELGNQLRGGPCETYIADMRVAVDLERHYVYPDLVVVCGEPQFLDKQLDTLLNPTVVVEVLSPSTKDFDRTDKLKQYQQVRSITDCLLVEQDRPYVTQISRLPSGLWTFTLHDKLEDECRLDAIGCSLRLADIFERVELAPERTWTPVSASRTLPPGAG